MRSKGLFFSRTHVLGYALTLLLTNFSVAADFGRRPAHENPDLSVELHAHLFMKKAMTWFFRGDFDEPLHASSWEDRFSSSANPLTLEESGIGIVVATLYAHPLFNLSMRDSVRSQIDQAENFVATHRNWIIARDAGEATRAIREGKRVMILGLEGASGILESEQDLQEFVDQRGIRIVTLLHLMDDEYGGAAFFKGPGFFALLYGLVRQLLHPIRVDGVRINDKGLTEKGRAIARQLIERGVWLDLSHSSDAAQGELIPMIEKAGHPLLYTHTVLRRYHRSERGISDSQLTEVKKTGGIVGLMPSEQMLEGTTSRISVNDSCAAGFTALLVQYREVAERIGAAAVDMGSDYNGGIPHLKPTCHTGTSLDREGLWNIGQAKDLWKAIAGAGAPVPDSLSRTVRYFLTTWARVSP